MELRQKYKLTALLELAEMPRSTYYYYVKQMQKPDKYAAIKENITAIYYENQGRYGYRRITMELHNRGYQVNHKTVQRLMKILHLKCMVRIKKYRSYKGEVGKIAPNILKRDFSTTAPNQKWTTDITEFALLILHPDFWRLLELLHEYSVPFTILGNPFHLNDQVCRKLKTYGCEKYQLSIDGLRETHDWFRKPGSYDCTLEKIGCINRAGIRSVVMTTVSKTNRMEIPGIIDAVVKAGVNVFAFSRYVPSGGDLDASMTPQEYRDLLTICDKKFKEYEAEGCDTYFNKKDHLWTLYEYETGEFKIPENAEDGMIYGGCNCGNCHITILPTGEVYACRRVADSHAGNIFTDRLADIWAANMECYREYTKFSKCAKCKLLAFCRGCPAVAKGTNGDFYAADPQCWADENSDLFRK